MNGVPRRASSSTTGRWTLLDELRHLVGAHPGHRRVRAHAAGVRPRVAVADPLEVLRGRERHHTAAVGEREDGHLLAGEQLLDHDRPGKRRSSTKAFVELLRRLADEHAFPGRSPSTLTTQGARATASDSAVGTPAAAMTSFAKLFEPSIRAAERPGRTRRRRFAAARRRRRRRAAASGPITARSTSRLRARPSSASPSSARTGWQSPSRAIPGLPGAACSAVSPGALGELPGERVLASTRADQEHLHGGRVYFHARLVSRTVDRRMRVP